MADDQLGRLFDYTQFHIKFYSAVITGLFAVIGFATGLPDQGVLRHLLPYAKWTTGLVLVAGAAGGAIASNLPNFSTFQEFEKARLNIFGIPTLRYAAMAHIEHLAFWLAVAVAASAFFCFQ